MDRALTRFFEIRETPGLKKKPSTSEILDWLKLLLVEDIDPVELKNDGKNLLPKLHGALLKNEQDIQLFERIAFIARGDSYILFLNFFILLCLLHSIYFRKGGGRRLHPSI